MEANRKYWDSFYETFSLSQPSSFAEMVMNWTPSPDLIVDLGCGNGRDAFYFAQATRANVLALDGSEVAIDAVRREAEKAKFSNRISAHKFDFETQSLVDLHDFTVGDSTSIETVVLYARFLIHALTEAGETGFWELVTYFLAMPAGSVYLAMEYRTPQDAELPKQTPNHFRRYVEPSQTAEKAERLGLSMLVNEEGSNLSVFGADNAFLCRQLFITNRQ